MFIEKLKIKGFGKLRDFTCEFSDGMNLVYGPNEAGKSTLQLFIKAMLFGLKGGRPAKGALLSPARKFRPWSGGPFSGTLIYRLDNGQRYRVERDFESGSVKVYDGYLNDITSSFAQNRENGVQFAAEHLGMNEACFERTVFIGQLDTRFDRGSAGELANRLINVSRTGYEELSLTNAEKALKEALISNVGTEKSSRRPLDILTLRIKELREEKAKQLERRKSSAALEEKLREALEEKLRLEAESRFYKAVRALLELKRALDMDRRRESGLRQALDDAVRVRGELGSSLKVRKASAPAFKYVFALLTVTGIIFTILLLSGFRTLFYPSLVLMASALAAGIFAVKRYISGGKAQQEEKAQTAGLGNELADIFGTASAVYGKQLGSEQALKTAIEDTARKVLAARAAADEAFEGVRLLSQDLPGAFRHEKAFAVLSSGFLERRLPESEIKQLERLIEKDLLETDNAHQNILLDIRGYETLLAGENNAGDSLQKLDEELEQTYRQKARLEGTGLALRLALDTLTEAGAEMQRTFLPLLNSSMSGIMNSLTGGAYSELAADEELTLKTVPPGTGQMTQALLLSGGTADQAYLALRLAAADTLFNGRCCLPVILDEAFSQYDDMRTEAGLRLLEEVSGTRQVILFTCKERERDAARDIFKNKLKVICLQALL